MDGERKLEQLLKEGIYGKPEIKKSERDYFLGEFKERVIRYLTRAQVEEPGIYPEILQAINHPDARKLIIDRRVDLEAAAAYIRLAHKNHLQFKRVYSPHFKGDVALIVAAGQAVDLEHKGVLSRKERLKAKGISDKIVENVGAKLCQSCWKTLKEKAPEELVNYYQLGIIDKLLGTKCVCKN